MRDNVAYLFPGQGTRYGGAALDFLEAESPGAKALFELASGIFAMDMAALLRDGDEQTLKRTDIAQPALTLCSLAAAAFLGERGFRPAACAGFSLGEYPALVAAGVIGSADCFRLIKARSRAMHEACLKLAEGGETEAAGMTAVIGLHPEAAMALIDTWRAEGLSDLYAANVNSPTQLVVSGTAAALKEGEARFAAAGARTMRLRVAGPFHSPLMAEAAEVFGSALRAVDFKDPVVPLYSNVSGARVESGKRARELAAMQITAPVLWTTEQRALLESGVFGACLEVGPGKTLRGFWKDSGAELPCHGAGTVVEIRALCTEVQEER